MVVGVSVFELHLPASRSLKEKRRVVKSFVERLHERLRVSVAETGFHDLHQRAEIGVAAVAVTPRRSTACSPRFAPAPTRSSRRW